ncbi:alpha-mannosidase [Bacillus gobiensis]|uniref:alpha-mannosidase n=1 Tax=Bacillus gobiensis TaxID=1441095 RepID=UPI003D20A930
MSFLKQKQIEKRIEELEQHRYRERRSLDVFFSKEDEEALVAPKVPEPSDFKETINVGSYWQGRDRYLWLAKEITIPKEWAEDTVVGLFDFGKTGEGGNSGFESQLYVDGKMYQAIDSNHKELFFEKEWSDSPIYLAFRLWSGLEGGGERKDQEHKIAQAEIAILDEQTDDLYYTAYAMLETIKVLQDHSPERVKLLSLLDKAFRIIDWKEPGSDPFYHSVYRTNDFLQAEIDQLEKHSDVTIRCIGHTHIDVAWLWRLKHTREKAGRSFSTVLRLMEKYPDYIFLQTQPQLYAYVKKDFPELYEEMKRRIDEGVWEVDGAMWLEADCNLPSGESLVRQILEGSKFIKNEFGKDVHYLWLPDVFGYSWALPQILKKSGIDTFLTSKISWNQFNRMPNDTFTWRGIDGSEVLTQFITTPDPGSPENSWFATYNGQILPTTVTGTWDNYKNKELAKELLLSYGYGDGGGGVNRTMLEMRRRLDKMPGLPHVKTGNVRPYFEELNKQVKETSEFVPTWDGELYLEYHRGTYTSQAYNKKMNRLLELKLRETEFMHVWKAVSLGGWETYPTTQLEESWRTLLRNQFHDIIPGSSIREVYEDSKKEYEEAEETADQLLHDAVLALTERKGRAWTIYNSSSWLLDGIVEVQTDEEGTWVDEEGNELTAQKKDNSWLVEVKQVPETGWKQIELQPSQNSKPLAADWFDFEEQVLETQFYRVEFNEQGQIQSLFDKEAGRHVLAENEKGNVFQIFEDKPLEFDAWDIDIYYQDKMTEVSNLEDFKLKKAGALQVSIEASWRYGKSTITQEMIFYKNRKVIDFSTHVDWHEQQQLLKVAFPVRIRATQATYDIQFGNVKRPTHWNTSWDMAKFETVAHQWVDFSEQNYGVSLLNDCKYGHDIKDHVIRLSLIKSAKAPDFMQDQGNHHFTYSLYPHANSWVEAETVKEAWKLNHPFSVSEGFAKGSQQLFAINHPFIHLDAVKKAEDNEDLIIRFHEFAGGTQDVTITPAFQYDGWLECDLRERVTAEEKKAGLIKLTVTPYEVKTVRIYRGE